MNGCSVSGKFGLTAALGSIAAFGHSGCSVVDKTAQCGHSPIGQVAAAQPVNADLRYERKISEVVNWWCADFSAACIG